MTTKATPAVLDLPYLMPEQFGAVGDYSANDSAAVLSSLQAAVSTGKPWHGMGRYRLDDPIVVDLDGNNPGQHLTMYCGGSQSQTFGVGDGGGIHFRGTGAARQHSVQIHDAHFEPRSANSAHPFMITGTEGGLTNRNSCLLRNVTCGPLDITGTNDFGVGPSVTGINRPAFDTIRIYQGTNCAVKWAHGLNVRGCYSPFFGGHSYINLRTTNGGANSGLRWGGDLPEAPEGFTSFGFIVNGGDIAVDIQSTNREPHFQWIGGHANGDNRCFRIEGLKYGMIRDLLLYLTATTLEVDEFIELVDVDGFEFQNQYRTNIGESTRLVAMRPGSGKVVRNVKINDFVLAADQNSGVEPYLVGAGCENIEINLPAVTADDDFASLPADLVEVEAGATNVLINTAEGPVSYDDGSLTGPRFSLTRLSESPAVNDRIGTFDWVMRNSVGERTVMASLLSSATNVTDGTEGGQLDFFIQDNGTLSVMQRLAAPSVNSSTFFMIGVRDGGVNTLQRVSVGANDSGGAGARVLTVPNV